MEKTESCGGGRRRGARAVRDPGPRGEQGRGGPAAAAGSLSARAT